VRDRLPEFQRLDAEVVAISVDSVHSHRAWAKQEGFNFPLLSDFNKEVGRAYGVLYEDFRGLKGVEKRAVFIVDGKGVVRYRWLSEDPQVLPQTDEILAELGKLSVAAKS